MISDPGETIMNAPYEVLLSDKGVLEGPTWDGEGGVYFSNVTQGGVYRLDLETREVACVAPHRKGIGGLGLTVGGDLVVSGRNVAVKRREGETEIVLSGESLGRTIIGFNDLTITPQGSIVVGALGTGAISPHAVGDRGPPPAEGAGTGAFFEVSREGVRLLADDIGHPNGVAYGVDGKVAYVSDTLRGCVFRFEVGSDGWSDRKVFARFDDALPDGMAVAEDGSLWLALALASEVIVFEANADVRTRIATATPLTTSVHFGGKDLRTAFITSGSHTGKEPATLLALPTSVAGLPMPRAIL
jgi:gluconolactonase